jgi:hypothetical protein
MTSRESPWHARSGDHVDVLIRCALRDRVTKANPSPSVWARIAAGSVRSRGFPRVLVRIGLRLESAGVCIPIVDFAMPTAPPRTERWGDAAPFGHELHWARLNRHHVSRLVA